MKDTVKYLQCVQFLISWYSLATMNTQADTNDVHTRDRILGLICVLF